MLHLYKHKKMGNTTSLNVVHDNYIGRAPFPCHLKLGTSAAIELSRKVDQKYSDGGHSDTWTVSYKLDNSNCSIRLTSEVGKDGNVNIIRFTHFDCPGLPGARVIITAGIDIRKTETNFLELVSFTESSASSTYRTGDTCTTVYRYTVRGSRGILVALELKKNSGYEQYNEATVTHYFADCSERDTGFSVAAKICISNGKLDIKVEGPEQHPPSGLLYMIGEVNRTGSWKPSMCPHCDQSRRHHRRMARQSDTEDSDSDLLPSFRASWQNAKRIVNSGRFRGHANGSSIWCKNFYGFN